MPRSGNLVSRRHPALGMALRPLGIAVSLAPELVFAGSEVNTTSPLLFLTDCGSPSRAGTAGEPSTRTFLRTAGARKKTSGNGTTRNRTTLVGDRCMTPASATVSGPGRRRRGHLVWCLVNSGNGCLPSPVQAWGQCPRCSTFAAAYGTPGRGSTPPCGASSRTRPISREKVPKPLRRDVPRVKPGQELTPSAGRKLTLSEAAVAVSAPGTCQAE